MDGYAGSDLLIASQDYSRGTVLRGKLKATRIIGDYVSITFVHEGWARGTLGDTFAPESWEEGCGTSVVTTGSVFTTNEDGSLEFAPSPKGTVVRLTPLHTQVKSAA